MTRLYVCHKANKRSIYLSIYNLSVGQWSERRGGKGQGGDQDHR